MAKKQAKRWTAPPAELLRPGDDFDLATMDRAATPGVGRR